MDTRIKTTDYELTSEVSAYLDERLAAIEKLLGDSVDATRAEVEIGRDAGRPRHGDNLYFAEISLVRPGYDRVVARNNAESVNAAIDDAKEEVMQQLRKQKQTREQSHREAGARAKDAIRSDE